MQKCQLTDIQFVKCNDVQDGEMLDAKWPSASIRFKWRSYNQSSVRNHGTSMTETNVLNNASYIIINTMASQVSICVKLYNTQQLQASHSVPHKSFIHTVTWWARHIRSRSCRFKNLLTTSAPKVKETPRSFSPQPWTSLSGSDHNRSHSKPEKTHTIIIIIIITTTTWFIRHNKAARVAKRELNNIHDPAVDTNCQ